VEWEGGGCSRGEARNSELLSSEHGVIGSHLEMSLTQPKSSSTEDAVSTFSVQASSCAGDAASI